MPPAGSTRPHGRRRVVRNVLVSRDLGRVERDRLGPGERVGLGGRERRVGLGGPTPIRIGGRRRSDSDGRCGRRRGVV